MSTVEVDRISYLIVHRYKKNSLDVVVVMRFFSGLLDPSTESRGSRWAWKLLPLAARTNSVNHALKSALPPGEPCFAPGESVV